MTRKGFDITSIATEMNQRVRSYLPLPRFVAAVLVSVEAELGVTTERGTIRVWNGGCPPVTLFQSGSATIHCFSSKHLPMGVVNRDAFDNSVEYFEYTGMHGQLLLCSDGLTELPLRSGKQLGQTGLLYRPVSHKKRFEKILKLVETELQDQSPTDDISLVLVDCPRPQEMQVGKKQQAEMKSYPAELEMQNDWSFALTLTAAQIKRLDIVPILLNVAGQFEEARIDGKLFIVLAELFNNALDHGLLKLDSSMKNELNGMELYFEERGVRLSELEQGSIDIRLEKLICSQGAEIRIHCRDSGEGFDYARLKPRAGHARHGRGITLLRNLCKQVEYRGNGSEVIAHLTL
jgi:anti-sigma regulatory factor (Ser/Thr protein kinase)